MVHKEQRNVHDNRYTITLNLCQYHKVESYHIKTLQEVQNFVTKKIVTFVKINTIICKLLN